mmetsp:Transcript_17436/g.19685  ORF Transcript_17436/g.19685 Transcript_17436/m.19685 type:complete len:396 (+) Transcript_17436:468-1655(+)
MASFTEVGFTLFFLLAMTSASIRVELETGEELKNSGERFLASEAKIELSNLINDAYYAKLGMGLDADKGIFWVPLQFDTSTSYMWVATNRCPCQGMPRDTLFNTSYSWKETVPATQAEMTLGASKGEGTMGTLPVYVSKGEAPVSDQVVYIVPDISDFGTVSYNGKVGFGTTLGSHLPATFFDNLVSKGIVAFKVFTVALAPKLAERKSYFILGQASTEDASSSLNYVEMNVTLTDDYKTAYSFTPDSISFGKSALPIKETVVHTGFPYLGIPSSLTDFAETHLSSDCGIQNNVIICQSCDSSKYPNFDFVISGTTYTIEPAEYMTISEGYCIIHITQSTEYDDKYLLGNVFMRNAIVVFDLENNKLGFALSSATSLKNSVIGMFITIFAFLTFF